MVRRLLCAVVFFRYIFFGINYYFVVMPLRLDTCSTRKTKIEQNKYSGGKKL